MQVGQVLSDKMKSLSVIWMFSEYSILYLEICLEFSSYGRLSFLLIQFQRVSLSYFPELLYHQISVWVSPTSLPRTKLFIDNPVDGAGFKLSGGIYSERSVAFQQNSGFSVFTCFIVDMSTCWMFCASLSSVHFFSMFLVPFGGMIFWNTQTYCPTACGSA